MGGLIPFGIVFREIGLIFDAFWLNHFDSLYGNGYLFIVLCMFAISCAQVSIMMTYLQLRREVSNKNKISVSDHRLIAIYFHVPFAGPSVVVAKLHYSCELRHLFYSLYNVFIVYQITANVHG